MWSSSSGWHGQRNVAGHTQRRDDATILWFDVQTSRGSVRADDGRVMAFGRHQLPSVLSDHELPGIARRRVCMASFRFDGASGEGLSAKGTGPGDGWATGRANSSLSAGNYRLAPITGPPWRSPSSEEPTSGSPGGGASGAHTQDDESDAGGVSLRLRVPDGRLLGAGVPGGGPLSRPPRDSGLVRRAGVPL